MNLVRFVVITACAAAATSWTAPIYAALLEAHAYATEITQSCYDGTAGHQVELCPAILRVEIECVIKELPIPLVHDALGLERERERCVKLIYHGQCRYYQLLLQIFGHKLFGLHYERADELTARIDPVHLDGVKTITMIHRYFQ